MQTQARATHPSGSITQQPSAPSVRPGAVLAVLASAQFVVLLSTSIVNVALPQIRDGVGLSDSGTTWVVNAYGLAFGALLLAGGSLSDLLGRRRVLLGGLGLFTGASVAAGLATTSEVLIAARAAQGVGAAAIAPAALALVLGVFPSGPGRGRVLGVWGIVTGAGGAAGVLLGGVLAEVAGWSWIFHACALGAALVLAGTAAVVPALRRPGTAARRFDHLGTAAVTLGLTALVWALTLARDEGWSSPQVLVPLALAALLLAAFVPIERRQKHPLVPPRLFTAGQVTTGNILMALLGSVWIALFFFLPLYQQHVLGTGPLATGLAQLPLAAANMVGSLLAPGLARRFGPVRTLTAALLVEAGGMGWLSRISTDSSYESAVLGPSIAIGLGLSVAFVQLTSLAVTGVRPVDAGLAGGLVNTTRQIGGAVGLAALSTLAASVTAASPGHHTHLQALTAGYRSAFEVSALILLVATALVPVLARRSGTSRRRR
ncbi:MFS transporter [Streptomyces sp. NPDC051207]|uniref:MFS transporter n=1 Tax=Streptomyces sp. NPDC051207 TaxID=3154641 RepID=UPI00341F319B